MRIKSIFILVALLFCLFLSTWAVQAAEDTGYPKTIVDSAGREVIIKMPVERIIVQSGYSAEAVEALGAANKIIGVTDTIHKRSEIYPLLKDKQVVGTWNSFDFEMIGELAKEGG